MKQDETTQAGGVGPDDFRSDPDVPSWGRGLLHRVDRACGHEAFVRCSGLQVELPSRRWLQEATEGEGADSFGGIAEAAQDR